MKVTNLGIVCDVCSSPNFIDENYEANIRYMAWIRCDKCNQKMWLTDEVRKARWES